MPTDAPDPDISARGVQSVEIGMRILLALAERQQPMTLGEIAQAAEMPAGRVHAYLTSLRRSRFVEQEREGSPYALGPSALKIGLARLHSAEPFDVAARDLDVLAQNTRCAVSLSVWGAHGATIVNTRVPTRGVWTNPPGTVQRTSITATGRVWAAYLGQIGMGQKIMDELQEITMNDRLARLSFTRIRDELMAIHARGFAIVPEELPGISAIAAPIFDHSTEVRFVVGLHAPSSIIDPASGAPQIDQLLSYTRDVSQDLGWRSGNLPPEPDLRLETP